MPRQDISVNPIIGEVAMADNLTNKILYDFALLPDTNEFDNDMFCYGEIRVPPNFEKLYNENKGIHVRIPYKPIYKQLNIRFKIDHENEQADYLINRINNRIWFEVYQETDTKSSIRFSEFLTLNENGIFNLIKRNGSLSLFSGNDTDFEMKPALNQNEIFLLKSFAGNLYQFPTAGVGLIEYLHGNFENSGLAAKLQEEFESDDMIIINAYMDSSTGELLLEVQEKNGEI